MDNKGYLNMELLRFTTAGSVDDGKSTLIGRLLYDSKSIFEDQMDAVRQASMHRGNEEVNLALLTDGLRAEREQGITIDVAYRYFATPKRKFIIADTPGHVQYTRNMVTGASTADLAVILVDARNGVVEQTVRHSCIASLLAIPTIFVCINKMDLISFDEHQFMKIKEQYLDMAKRLAIGASIHFIPISAKHGDNVVEQSPNMPWYDGMPLLGLLETIPIRHKTGTADQPMRLPVQYVIRPISDQFHDYRAYAGRIASGIIRVGDKIKVLPSGVSTTVSAILQAEQSLAEAVAPQSVSIQTIDDIDISRGDMIVHDNRAEPYMERDITMMCCWFSQEPLLTNKRYIIKSSVAESYGMVKEIVYKLDIGTMNRIESSEQLQMNDIACIKIRTANPMAFDSYNTCRTTGSFIFIDPSNFETIGAGMSIEPSNK